jgi:phosphomannomutase
MDTGIQKRAAAWTEEPFDHQTQETVQHLLKFDPEEAEECFYQELSFGTGGLRALMGVGTNRLNNYIIRKTTQGLSNYLQKECLSKDLSVVIGFDNRFHSEEFAKEAASTLVHNGINVYLLKELRPTPFVSFACRHFKANAAIMITASHNPKEYNGYKVYWQDGAQVVPPHDTGIIEEVSKVESFALPYNEAKGTLHVVGSALDEEYLKAIRPLRTGSVEGDLKIVYTSLHGTGITLTPKALKDWGFSSISYVKDQITIDGSFPTVKVPNPEYKEALKLGLDLLKSSDSDLLLATDPDADRLGVSVLHNGEPVILNGNEIASICLEYLCITLKAQGRLPPKSAAITSIVSTALLDAIAKEHGILCERVLTGFKYIGEKIHEWEIDPKNSPEFLFGAEESYGYLYGTHSRDKDAIISSCLIAEIALHLKNNGKTLVDFLHSLYEKYGVFKEDLTSLVFSSDKKGQLRMQNLMDTLREKPIQSICDLKVIKIDDYLDSAKTGLPKSNVLMLHLEDESRLIIRPSGTEPKVKIYAGVRIKSSSIKESLSLADEKLLKLLRHLKGICETI